MAIAEEETYGPNGTQEPEGANGPNGPNGPHGPNGPNDPNGPEETQECDDCGYSEVPVRQMTVTRGMLVCSTCAMARASRVLSSFRLTTTR
jgi:hypothetical protein